MMDDADMDKDMDMWMFMLAGMEGLDGGILAPVSSQSAPI